MEICQQASGRLNFSVDDVLTHFRTHNFAEAMNKVKFHFISDLRYSFH